MTSSPSKFRSLKGLTLEWSIQGGEPGALTLRRICDWAICGAFPARTFLFPNGEEIDLLTLHQAMRMSIGLGAPINPDVAIDILQRAMVGVAGIEAFSKRVGIDPPQSIKTLALRFGALLNKPRYQSPPDCPESAEIVARLEARWSALAAMNSLKAILVQYRGDSRASISEQADERWVCYVNLAQPSADSSKDSKIQSELAALKHEWESLRDASSVAASSESAQPEERIDLHSTGPKKRGVGRPQGSGSLESKDLVLVAEMRKGIVDGKFPSISAAAKAMAPRAGGGGTEASKEQRLRKRYSELYPS
ncbi:hypothetical protein ABIB83_008270 [Bradyrhizobium sp. I1.8.5]|uniref:hypothetical protein n=1 Tax=Bradyrhizobium sp. I1.8.5 TaxID=3156365 RepID=UPI0033958542